MVRSTPREPPSSQAVASAVEAALDDSVSAVTPIQEGLNAVYQVRLTQGDHVVLKAATVVTDERLLVEARLLARLGTAVDVPVPALYATLESQTSPLDVAAVVMEHCDGRTVPDIRDLSKPARDRIVADAGRYLGIIHAARLVDNIGPLQVTDGNLIVNPRYDTWPAWFRELVDDTIAGLRGEGFTTDTEPRFTDLAPEIRASLLDAVAAGDWGASPSLLFGDYRPANLILTPAEVEQPGVRAVIDVACEATGDGLVDLALAEDAIVDIPFGDTDRAEDVRRKFRTAYCRARGIDTAELASDRYTAYRLFARARHLGGFDYWRKFAWEADPETTERRWRAAVRTRIRELA